MAPALRNVVSALAAATLALVTASLTASPALSSSPRPAAPKAATGEGNAANLDYFLDAGNPAQTPSKNFGRTDFASLTKTLKPASTLTSPHGSATASASIDAFAGGFPSTLTEVTVTGKVSGRATSDGKPADVPVASSSSSFTLDFSGTDVPFVVVVHGSASNSDADDCTTAGVGLTADTQDGLIDLVNVIAAGGGDCVRVDGGLMYSGVLTGSGTLDVSVDATVDPEEKGSESYSGSYSVGMVFFDTCQVQGTPGADPDLNGTPGDDIICGMGGADSIDGMGGDDTIFGGGDVDTIDAGPGADLVYAGAGADVVQGGVGDDSLSGGDDEDVISDSAGPNLRLDGDAGDDIVCGSQQRDRIHAGDGGDFVLGLGGPDVVDLGAGNDTALGDGDVSDVLALGCAIPSGNPGADKDDTVLGGTGDDLVVGGAGKDTLKGDAGSDKLRGEAGGDALVGGTRKDVLNGGTGGDTLNACDGVLDSVLGGPGSDLGRVDRRDDVTSVETRRSC